MTYSISPSFSYIRPINILNDGTIYRNGIENTDRTLAILSQPKTAAKVPSWQVVRHDRSAIVACHNLASARAYASGRLPNKVVTPSSYTYKATPYQAPSGQFYVMIHAGVQQVRMDVANAQTARHYAKNGVDTSLATSAYLASFNQ